MGVVIILLEVDIATTSFYIVPIATFGSFGDEYGHEMFSEKKGYSAISFFFQHRFLLKSMAVLCVLLSYAEVIHLVAFLSFDIGYDAVGAAWKAEKEKNS